MPFSAGHLGLALGLLAAASASDVARHRVPNALAVAVLASGIGARIAASGLPGAVTGFAAAVAVGGLLWAPWRRRVVGGGDLKLAAGAGAWVGLEGLGTYLFSSALAAGLLAIACHALSSREARARVVRNLALATHGVAPDVEATPGRVPVPAAAAFAAGAVFTLASGALR